MNEADDLARRCAEAMLARDDASRLLGIEVETMREGYAALTMAVQPHMTNGHDVCHGGFLFTLGDTAMAFASNSRNESYLALNAAIEFLAVGLAGETLRAVAEERHRSGRTAMYDVHIENERGELVAIFRGRTYRVSGSIIDELK